MSELKNCPFCGGEAELYGVPHIPKGWDFIPRCKTTSCCGRQAKKYSSREVAIAAWNRRAPSCEIQQYAESCADCGFCNAPLTLDELRGMDGEPVYLQFGDGVCGWAIVLIDGDWITFECPDFDGHCEPDVDFINMEYNDPDGHFGLHILGWRALRRKPEPGKEELT